MVLEGVVTNVTRFGAFVDVGVHQDGLVHISELSNKFIKDPSEAVKAGQIVKVKVLSADARTKRVSLSIKALLEAPAQRPGGKRADAPRGASNPTSNPNSTSQARGKVPPKAPSPPPTMEEKIAALANRWQKR
jgi:uncharacterized protein